jgi:hypothetical protein
MMLKSGGTLVKRSFTWAVVLGLAGLVIGYLLFGKIIGQYVNITNLFVPDRSMIGQSGNSAPGIDSMRFDILMCGLGGVLAGSFIAIVMDLYRKRKV